MPGRDTPASGEDVGSPYLLQPSVGLSSRADLSSVADDECRLWPSPIASVTLVVAQGGASVFAVWQKTFL